MNSETILLEKRFGSGILSADASGSADGGRITLSGAQLNLGESQILSNAGALGGSGGKINIRYDSATVLSINGLVSASGPVGNAGEIHIANDSLTAPLVVALKGVISTQSATGNATTFFGDRTQPAKDVIVFLEGGGRFHDIFGRTGVIDSDVNAYGSFVNFRATASNVGLTVDKIDSVSDGRVVLDLATRGSSVNLVSKQSYIKIETGVANLVPIAFVSPSIAEGVQWRAGDGFETFAAESTLGRLECLIAARNRTSFHIQDLTIELLPNTVSICVCADHPKQWLPWMHWRACVNSSARMLRARNGRLEARAKNRRFPTTCIQSYIQS